MSSAATGAPPADTTPDATAEAPPDPRRWWALAAVVLSVLVLNLDSTVLNVALPTLAVQLHAGTGTLQWIVDGYLIVFAAAMLPAGLLGDRFGRRRLLVAGLVLFGAASLAGALANDAHVLIAVRAVMGLGGALIMPLSMAVLPGIFPAHERKRAVGLLTAGVGLGMPLGPLIGGLLLDHFWWGSIFLINVPVAALGALACVLLVPESVNPAAPRVDVLSAVLGVAGLAALTFGIIQGPGDGWTSATVLTALVGSVALLGGLVWRERGQSDPMLDLRLLADRAYRWNLVATVLVTFALMGALFVVPQYLQSVLGNDALGTGLRLMPLAGGLIAATRVVGPLTARFGARVVVPGGMAVLAAALLLGATTGSGDGYGSAAVWLVLTGVGMGLVMVPAMGSALAALPVERAGVGSGLLQTLRQFAGAVGVALLGSLLASAYASRLDSSGQLDASRLSGAAAHTARGSVTAADAVASAGHDPALAAAAHSAFLHGMDLVLLVCGIGAVAAAVLVALRLPGGPESEA